MASWLGIKPITSWSRGNPLPLLFSKGGVGFFQSGPKCLPASREDWKTHRGCAHCFLIFLDHHYYNAGMTLMWCLSLLSQQCIECLQIMAHSVWSKPKNRIGGGFGRSKIIIMRKLEEKRTHFGKLFLDQMYDVIRTSFQTQSDIYQMALTTSQLYM